MPRRSALLVVPRTYAELRDAVLAVVVEGRREIDRAWVGSYHEIGRLIHEHLLFKQARATYGAGVFADLSKESGISSRTLHECVQFFRRIPIVRRGAQFNWAKYRVFCQVGDESARLALMTDAAKQGWSTDQLIERVRALNAALDIAADANNPASAEPVRKLLTPRRGTPGVCQVIEAGDGPTVDLGFACYRDLPATTNFRAGEFARVTAAGVERAAGATKADLFTYHAVVLKVVDGDTLWVKVVLEPGRWVKQKLRLRDLDCPEIDTPEGKAAKRFTESLVSRARAITISTTKPDKYDRYLADVFLVGSSGGEIFLNNALLEAGHAVTKKAWEFGDWGVAG